jgi:hypothetical protein
MNGVVSQIRHRALKRVRWGMFGEDCCGSESGSPKGEELLTRLIALNKSQGMI